MKTVLAFGCFDILHYGHLQYLRKAKGFGDRLIVVVARDATIRKVKGREPVFDEAARREIVKSLGIVDDAVLGHAGGKGKYEIVRDLRPDVIALGYDQPEEDARLRKWLDGNGMAKVKVVRIRHVENAEVYKSSRALDKLRRCVVREI